MNTPAHLIFGLAVFGRPNVSRVTAAALAAALIPDASLYVMAGWSLFVMGIDARIVFGELYFSDLWQAVFRVDNSFILWGGWLCCGALVAAGLGNCSLWSGSFTSAV